jgi:hypothetical protein
VWLRFDHPISTVALAHSRGIPEPWFTTQRRLDNELLVWFPDGLQEGDTIQVTAP